MNTKENRVTIWDKQYESLEVTYTEDYDTPSNLSQKCSYQFVYEDIVERDIAEKGCQAHIHVGSGEMKALVKTSHNLKER